MLGNVLKQEDYREFTQFELTTNILNNLKQFDLTPVAKLVLLELSTHYNGEKNGAVVFPSIETIAETLGVGLTATKKAIKDLIAEGLIIKSKMSKVHGNYNKYCLTLKVQGVKGHNTTYKRSENELSKQSKNDLFYIGTNKDKQITNKEVNKENFGGNVYQREDDVILYEYAKKRAKKSVEGYVRFLKSSGAAKSIIKEHNKPILAALYREKTHENLMKEYESFKVDSVMPSESLAWVELGKRLRKK